MAKETHENEPVDLKEGLGFWDGVFLWEEGIGVWEGVFLWEEELDVWEGVFL